MKASRNSRRATRRALKQATNRIRWADGPERSFWRTPSFGVIAAGVTITGIGIVTAHKASADPRLADPGCVVYTVQPGDNLSKIAAAHGHTLDTILGWNPQFPNPNLIYVDDQVCVARDETPRLFVNEMQPAGLAAVIAEREPDGRATRRAILAALYDAGARGTQLVTLAAITEGESGRKVDAIGDVGIQTSKWGPSGGAFQIRSVKAERGQGTTRDLDRVLTLEGGALSAVELWNQALERGQDPGSPWTAYLKRWHVAHLDGYAEIARTEGWLS